MKSSLAECIHLQEAIIFDYKNYGKTHEMNFTTLLSQMNNVLAINYTIPINLMISLLTNRQNGRMQQRYHAK